MKIILLIATYMSFSFLGNAQCDSLSLDTLKVYKDLDAAMLNPEEVFHLDLSRKKLKEFPEEIFMFKNLRVLILNKNKLKEIPEKINQLGCLQILEVESNKLYEINMGILQLKSLVRLNLADNVIEAIPSKISKLQNLEELILWSNIIGEYPPELSQLKRLKTLDLLNIEMSVEEQDLVNSFLPNVEVILSEPCNCSFD